MRKTFAAWGMAAALINPALAADKPVTPQPTLLGEELKRVTPDVATRCVEAAFADEKGLTHVGDMLCMRASKNLGIAFANREDGKVKCMVGRAPKDTTDLALIVMVMENGNVIAGVQNSAWHDMQASLSKGVMRVTIGHLSERDKTGLKKVMDATDRACNGLAKRLEI